MNLNVIKRFFSILLALFVLATALVSVLAIWKVIDIDDILSKSLTSLLVSLFLRQLFCLFLPFFIPKLLKNLQITHPYHPPINKKIW